MKFGFIFLIIIFFISGCSASELTYAPESELTYEQNLELLCSWQPEIKNFPGCENITCPSPECDDWCGKGVKVYFDSKDCKELEFSDACSCPPYQSISQCEKSCLT